MVYIIRGIHVRYFVVTYIQKADGQFDESVQVVEKNLTNKINVTASVILDFKERKVVKARLSEAIPKDWELIRNYYYSFYGGVIDQLEKAWPLEEQVSEDETQETPPDQAST